MANKSRLIIYGSDRRKALYSGDGTIDQWRERLGELAENQYYVFQVERLVGATEDLRITNTAFLKVPGSEEYTSLGKTDALFPLGREAKNMLLELIADSIPEQQRR